VASKSHMYTADNQGAQSQVVFTLTAPPAESIAVAA
jgi:hypothetical protein